LTLERENVALSLSLSLCCTHTHTHTQRRYTVNLGITDSMKDIMEENDYKRTRGVSSNSTGSNNSLRSNATFTIVLNRREDAVSNFGTDDGFRLSKIAIRTTKVSEIQRLESAIRNAMQKYEDRSCKYTVEFAGRRLLRFPQSTNRNAAIVSDEVKSAEGLVVAPLSPIVVTIRVSREIFANLTPEIQNGKKIPVRPVLVSQGISGNLTHQGHRSLFGKAITDFRNRVNYAAVRHFMGIVNDCMSLPESCAYSPMERQRIDALTKELKLRLQRSSTQPQAEPGVLMLASDLANALGAIKLTNCMSGKDRTGMSVTLEQARWLARNYDIVHPSERAVVSTVPGTQLPQARTDNQLVTLEKKPLSSVKLSRVVKLANIFRLCGPRVHLCRKNVGKAKFKGQAACDCYDPPKIVANALVEA